MKEKNMEICLPKDSKDLQILAAAYNELEILKERFDQRLEVIESLKLEIAFLNQEVDKLRQDKYNLSVTIDLLLEKVAS